MDILPFFREKGWSVAEHGDDVAPIYREVYFLQHLELSEGLFKSLDFYNGVFHQLTLS